MGDSSSSSKMGDNSRAASYGYIEAKEVSSKKCLE